MPSCRVWCAFAENPSASFPVVCEVNEDTYFDLKSKVRNGHEDPNVRYSDMTKWLLYQPGSELDNERKFFSRKEDSVINAGLPIQPERRSADPAVEVVILISHKPNYDTVGYPPAKKRVEEEFAATGLPYCAPASDALVKSSGNNWDYQTSQELRDTLRREIKLHFNYYEKGITEKRRIPIYLFLSGAGTGKSRNAAELHNTVYKCFDGSYSEKKDEKIVTQLQSPAVFHVSFENESLALGEGDPLLAIGIRMLYQLLRQYDQNLDIDSVKSNWYGPTPKELIRFLQSGDHSAFRNRAMFLIVDGLNEIGRAFGAESMRLTLTLLGNLQDHLGFMVVCCTSTVAGPTDEFAASERRRIFLPCSPLEPPKVDRRPVFEIKDMVQHVLVNDCGGHGRALEMMVDVFDDYPASIGPNVKFMVAGKLKNLYGRNVVPENEEDQVAIIKAVLTNQRLSRYQCIPGTNLTPDTICQSGLIGFEGVEPGASVGYLRVPYIWVLTLCMLHSNPLVDELQLFDYQDFWAKYNPTMPGQFSWSDFEKLMVKIRKLKSHVFHDGAEITVGDMHAGGVMTHETKNIRFVNHHLKDDLAKHRTGTKTIVHLTP